MNTNQIPEPMPDNHVNSDLMPEYQSEKSSLFSIKLETKKYIGDQRHLHDAKGMKGISRDQDSGEIVSSEVTNDSNTNFKPGLDLIDVFDQLHNN